MLLAHFISDLQAIMDACDGGLEVCFESKRPPVAIETVTCVSTVEEGDRNRFVLIE